MKYIFFVFWKVSLAIVFSELTCINGDCSILGYRGGGSGEANKYVFRQLIVKLNNNYLLFRLVPNAKDKTKESYQDNKRSKKIQAAAIFVHRSPAWCLSTKIYL